MTLRGREFGKTAFQRLRCESGATLVEFAVSFTLMMTFVFVVMEACIGIYTYAMISDCAREGTRWAITRGSTCQTAASASCTASATQIQSHATGMGFPNPGGGTMNATASFPDTTGTCTTDNAPGCRVKLVITYTMPIKIPLVPKNSIIMGTSSEMYILQ